MESFVSNLHLQNILNLQNGRKINFRVLSQNKSLTLEFIELNPNEDWIWGIFGLSNNPIITPEFIESNLEKEWHWGIFGLSDNPAITPEFVESHPEKEWYYGREGLSSNPSITFEFVKSHPEKKWDCYSLLKNPFTLEKKMLLKRVVTGELSKINETSLFLSEENRENLPSLILREVIRNETIRTLKK